MLGAIAGDVIGSIYEWNNIKSTIFPLFSLRSRPTDDSVMTLAMAEWIMDKQDLVTCLQKWGRLYPNAGYGGSFKQWLKNTNPQPYNSWGNGSAMRVSPVGWCYDTLEETLEQAKASAEVTHNHPEGIKGAQSVAAAIFMARKGSNKEEIKNYLEENFFGYDLTYPLDKLRQTYSFDVSCQGSVPPAIRAFLESEDWESAVRLAISIGGDSDTIACIAGSIAEAYYQGMPEHIKTGVFLRLDENMTTMVERFYEYLAKKS
ncbi:MAG: ADP-ribosylglycohydrolase family protein [Bacteroidia bacterium]